MDFVTNATDDARKMYETTDRIPWFYQQTAGRSPGDSTTASCQALTSTSFVHHHPRYGSRPAGLLASESTDASTVFCLCSYAP